MARWLEGVRRTTFPAGRMAPLKMMGCPSLLLTDWMNWGIILLGMTGCGGGDGGDNY